ncbi:autotransporter outer membrane beta-barrel domain-containing protein [Chryseobacterium polytrichastri]|uniref:Uncharacterized protein n=1 Tax=Chryseobacterium polytrichastri TaxID=1302687 RepID=A0A1M6V401_9FLAO|nr:hypothetical protein [Chryseobacterium polytrichastri]SHK76173.1 hypothetical protein SAMN05444267_1007132 [Chryseobacterium polytrichastri]
MKKLTLSIVIALSAFCGKAEAQVGINTASPASSLDITAKNPTGTTSIVEGVLMPRVDRQRAQSMTAIPTSTLLYVNNVATGTQTGTAVNIDAVGYYYFDGATWVKLYNPNSTPFGLGNIYTTDGTLSGNRIVTQGTNTITFTGTAVNAFSVAGSNFSVDGTNNRVGIGTATPLSKFHVNGGESRFSNTTSAWALGPTTGGTTGSLNSFEVVDRVNNIRRMVFNDNGDVSLGGTIVNNAAGGVVSIRSGNVGVGTATPQKQLHVTGALQVTNELNVGGSASTAGSAGASGEVLVSGGTGAAPSWQPLAAVSGTIAAVYYVQGTTAATINAGATADVPGVTLTVAVPAGRTQTFLFNILGYALGLPVDGVARQGAFSLLQNGVKVSSAYTSMVGVGGGLNNLPVPVTFLKSITLTAGTYTFKVQYSSWSGNQTVNYNPTNYAGYNGDTEAMLTKMQVMVENN